MLGVARYHTIPLPKGWPRRVRAAVIQVIPLSRVARRITPSLVRTWPSRHRLVSLVHYTSSVCSGSRRLLVIRASQVPPVSSHPLLRLTSRRSCLQIQSLSKHELSVESRAGAVASGRGESLLPAAFATTPVPQSSP
jgi:hypothetical protein